MSNLTMPSITIAFKTAANATASRNGRGVVGIILRDAATASGAAVLYAAADLPEKMAASNKAFVERALLGARCAIVYTLPTEGELQTALDYMATQAFSWLCVAGATEEDNAAVVAWIKAQRETNHAIYKAVLADTAADCERVVNLTAEGLAVGKETFGAEDYTSRVAGVLAGLPLTQSVTYYALNEVQDVTRMPKAQQDEAVGAGKLIAFYDGGAVRLGRGVTSLSTVSETAPESLKKIHVLEVRDTVENDLRNLISAHYIGKYMNTYKNKLVLLTAVKTYLKELEVLGIVQEGSNAEFDLDAQRAWLQKHGANPAGMTEQEILEANTDTHVFLKVKLAIYDAMEDMDITIYC